MQMNRRNLLVLLAATIALSANTAVAQDTAGVSAASKAFYEALSVLDDGSAMAKVWANKPYVTYVGPRSKSIIVGWDAQRKYWEEFNKAFAHRSVSLSDARIRVNGDLAWEIGIEIGQAQMKDGTTRKVDWIVTNVYEKTNGRWLMVSHHVQPRPE
jgi:ketosteroid isomerase-like protein